MTLQVVQGDITEIESGLIGHVVNNQGVMGAGVARALYEKWPAVRQRYIAVHERGDEYPLGATQIVPIIGEIENEPVLMIANMIAQKSLGADVNIDYIGLDRCLDTVGLYAENYDLQVYFPYGMGAGLAGGDWNIIVEMIERFCPGAILVKLP